MHYFLIRENDQLQHLPDFCLIAPEQDSTAANGPNGTKRSPNDRQPVQFVCPHHSAELPLSFLVVDEEATIRVCSGRMLKAGDSEFILTGVVTDEYEASCKATAFRNIQAAMAVSPK